jgi:hypothetical protein
MDNRQLALLGRVQKARARLEEQQDAVDEARAAYVEAVRRLNDSGVPLREIAEELGLSHQRVHQMVAGGTARPSAAKRAARGVAGMALILALTAAIVHIARAEIAPLADRTRRRLSFIAEPLSPSRRDDSRQASTRIANLGKSSVTECL